MRLKGTAALRMWEVLDFTDPQSFSGVVGGVLNAYLAALIESARVLNATAFAFVPRRMEPFLVGAGRPIKEIDHHTNKQANKDD